MSVVETPFNSIQDQRDGDGEGPPTRPTELSILSKINTLPDSLIFAQIS